LPVLGRGVAGALLIERGGVAGGSVGDWMLTRLLRH
jgi:hypothetical protein